MFREFTLSGFARYNVYGSLAAVVVFLFWAYLSAIVFLLGIEVNAELDERHAARESEGRAAGDAELRAAGGSPA